jgi:hypothetical protein
MPNALSVPNALPEMFSIVTELAEPPLSAVIVKPSVRRLYFIVTPRVFVRVDRVDHRLQRGVCVEREIHAVDAEGNLIA